MVKQIITEIYFIIPSLTHIEMCIRDRCGVALYGSESWTIGESDKGRL